jgi:cysteinyl-tRNA synthetase
LVRLANDLFEKPDITAETLNAVDDSFTKLGGDCLGIVKNEYPQTSRADDMIEKLVESLIERRSDARNRKDFAAADAIRDKLNQIGIVLEDKPDTTTWRFK